MKLWEFVEKLQCMCYEGLSELDVEITDDNGNTFEIPDNVKVATDHRKKIVQVTAHKK
jgi:hypothetical protein